MSEENLTDERRLDGSSNGAAIKADDSSSYERKRRRSSRSRSRSRSPRRSSYGGGGGKRDRRGGIDASNDRMVYISNIPYDVRWMEVKDLVREKAGEVSFVEVLETPDGKSKGCAVVEFKDREGAKKCIESMHRFQMKDRYIVAKEIRDPGAFFRKVKEDIGVDFLASGSGRNRFSGESRGPSSRPLASGTYDTYGLSPTFLRQLGIDGPLCNRVFVANLAYNIQSGRIYDIFSLAGKVTWVDVQVDKEGKSKGLAVIEYSHPIEAVQSISMLNNQRLMDRSITVKMDKYEKPPEKRPGELPAGLRAVGMGLGANGAPLANIAQLLSSQNQPPPAAMGGFQQQQQQAQPPSMYGSGVSMGGGMGGSGYNSGGGGGGMVGGSSFGSGGQGPMGGGGFTGGGYDSGPIGFGREVGGQSFGYGDRMRSSDMEMQRPTRVIVIRNLPMDYTWQMVRDRLRGYGDIEFADIISPGVAKVRFKTNMDAERARTALHGTTVEGRPITVDYGFND